MLDIEPGGTAILGPSEYRPEDWAMYSSLTHLKFGRAGSIISVEHLSQILQLKSLEHLQLSHAGDMPSPPGLELPPVCLDNLHTLELAHFCLHGDLTLECPQLHTLRLTNNCPLGRVRMAACPELRTLSFKNSDLGAADPQWLGLELLHVQGLTSLSLDSCLLTAIPHATLSMSALKQLTVAGNNIWALPPALLPLEVLSLSRCDFSDVPQMPEAVTSLTRLELGLQDMDC